MATIIISLLLLLLIILALRSIRKEESCSGGMQRLFKRL